jgi:hypothetical protein
MHHFPFLVLFVAIACSLSSTSSVKAGVLEDNRIALHDLAKISVIVEDIDKDSEKCELRSTTFESDTINLLIPAGLGIDQDALPYLYININTLYLDLWDGCVSSFRVEVRNIVDYPDYRNQEKRRGVVVLFRTGGILSSARNMHGDRTRKAVKDGVSEFLAEWRIANADTGLVRPSSSEDDVSAPLAQLRIAQERLRSLGLYTGSVDGKYGPGTRKAVLAYQNIAGLTPTGLLDVETIEHLLP